MGAGPQGVSSLRFLPFFLHPPLWVTPFGLAPKALFFLLLLFLLFKGNHSPSFSSRYIFSACIQLFSEFGDLKSFGSNHGGGLLIAADSRGSL